MGALDQALCLFSDLKRAVYRTSGGKCPEDFLYVMAVGGIGEPVLTCSQTHHLRRTERPVCFVVREDRAWVTSMWPHSADVFIQVTPAQMQLLTTLEDLSFLVQGHLYISYVSWLAGGQFADRLIMRERLLGFREAFAFGLGLPLNSPVALPAITARRIPWNPGKKSVLIMPNANFVRAMPRPFWQALARDFVDRGFEVFFEQFGGEALEEAGVTNIQTCVLDFIELASRCNLVVMLRSGLSDLLSACSRRLPQLKLVILWHLDPTTRNTLLELWHAPGCSVGYPSSTTWFECDGRVHDIEVDPRDEAWLQTPVECLKNVAPILV